MCFKVCIHIGMNKHSTECEAVRSSYEARQDLLTVVRKFRCLLAQQECLVDLDEVLKHLT